MLQPRTDTSTLLRQPAVDFRRRSRRVREIAHGLWVLREEAFTLRLLDDHLASKIKSVVATELAHVITIILLLVLKLGRNFNRRNRLLLNSLDRSGT